MATSSITKEFIIEDDETCERLLEILTTPPSKKYWDDDEDYVSEYEEGKALAEKYFGR